MLSSTENVQLDIYTSNESVGKYAEYIRDGLDWDQWVSNMKFLMESKRIGILHVMFTINSLCLESLPDFLNLLLEWKQQYDTKLEFSINIQRFPSFQSAIVLPIDIRTQYSQRILLWLEENKQHNLLQSNEINQLQRLIDYLKLVDIPHGDNFDREQLQHEYKSFYSQYDVRRNKKFEETFKNSILIDWYKSLTV